MKLARTSAYQSFVALFLLAIGLGAYGCSDSATVNPEVELASLTVSSASGPVALRPTFSSTTTQYSVEVPNNITSVTITAHARVAGDTVSIDGQTTTSRSITVGPVGDPPTVVSIVVSESTSKSRTYTVALNRTPLAGNNDLSALSVTSGTLDPAFESTKTRYTVNVGSTVTSVIVSATKADPNAVMSDDVTAGAGVATGQATIQLGGPGTATVVSIIVTAPNGSSNVYLVTVNHLSGNNNLSALSVTAGNVDLALTPPFPSNTTTTHTVNVATDVTSVIVSATKADPNAVLSGSVADPGAGQATGQATTPLNGPGTDTPVRITVTAPDGLSKNYDITVRRAASNNNNLSALSVTPGTWDPKNPFNPNTTSYRVDVATNVTQVTVTATKSDPNAVLSGSVADPGAGQAIGQATIPLGGPLTTTPVTITVTAPDGTPKRYKIDVFRTFLPFQ